MRIAYVIINANRHEGTSRAVLEVAERLAGVHRVDIWARTFEATRDQVADRGTTNGDAVFHDKLNLQRIAGPGRPEIADFGSFKLVADRRLKTARYDIIHSAGPNTSLADVYTIQTVHSVKVAQLSEVRKTSSAGLLRRLSWRLYDGAVLRAERDAYQTFGPRGPKLFLPVSVGTRDELIACYPDIQANCENSLVDYPLRGFDPIAVIPNGADLDLFHPRQRERFRSEVRQKHGFRDDDFIILFSGGDWRRKGLDLLLYAITMLRDDGVRLLVVGDDRNGNEIRSMVDKLELASRVTFAGFRKDVHRYYAAGDLFVFPTSYEAFSLATIEAAASGLPVVMTPASGAVDLLGSGDCGAIVSRDPHSIAEQIRVYRRNPELLAKHGANARAKAERDYSWDGIAKQTLGVYERLIEYRKAMSRSVQLGQGR
jgi:glycosyltransferase involved in cell wall biosynthesis